MNDIQQKALEMVQAMSGKLGVASGHIWEVLVKQSLVSAVVDSFYLVLVIIGLITLPKYVYKLFLKAAKMDDYDAQSISQFGLTMLSLLILVFSAFVLICTPESIATGFFNPEFKAAEFVLDAISSKK